MTHSSKEHKHHAHHCHGHHNLQGKNMFAVVLLNLGITAVQFIGGFFANSLSLVSDALHNLGDSVSMAIAWLAYKMGQRQATQKHTFGFRRFEIMAAMFNALTLIIICLYLFYESYQRWLHPETVHGALMVGIAVFGLLANLISVLVLHRDRGHNLNVRAAYLHLIGDTLSSVAVVIGGICIWKWGITWIDPLITMAVAVYLLIHTWPVFRHAAEILMQRTPRNMDLAEIQKQLEKLPMVKDIHHVHAWQLDDKQLHFEAHVQLKQDLPVSETEKLRQRISHLLEVQYGIQHLMLQFEYGPCPDIAHLVVTPAVH